MKAKEAEALGRRLAQIISKNEMTRAYALIAPVLKERTRFPVLGRIGKTLGLLTPDELNTFLDHTAQRRTMGGWVVIGCALEEMLSSHPLDALSRCRRYIIQADTWYAVDILAERVPGPALVKSFSSTLDCLSQWRPHENRWVRRAVGVAAHFWAKRSNGVDANLAPSKRLLAFLEPMFSEWDMDAAKGVGWGLKTMGKMYPDLMAEWLPGQLNRKYRALMLKKAMTYLPAELKNRIADCRTP